MPKPTRQLKACCGTGAALEFLYLVAYGDPERPTKTRFGCLPICARCRAPVGAVELDRSAPARRFTATSWALMTKTHPHPPYHFVAGLGDELVPEAHTPDLSAAPAPPDETTSQETRP